MRGCSMYHTDPKTCKVMIQHTSDKVFKTLEEAQAATKWIEDNLPTKKAPYPYAYVKSECGGIRYIAFTDLDNPISVEEFLRLEREDPMGLPALFDNQKLVIVE